ncbi:hypothetical protein BCR21_08490 [Enterococcus ureasiticus]|uniref:PA14 domain-containing protein n=2 Tax=Enterococcus ureasiticus TaxID=903984 RepID=A0A1E5GF43_9ENTE|nr:hypothetical protein BCR21_08490 [Enterococcus ureasiticus]
MFSEFWEIFYYKKIQKMFLRKVDKMKKNKRINVFIALIIFLCVFASGTSAMAKETVSKAEGTASISGVLFEDLNVNGKQEANEAGIEGITVKLLDDSSAEITKTITNKEGKYTFDKLPANMYSLKIDYPTGYIKVTEGDIKFDAEGFSSFFELDDGETYTGAWMGFNSAGASIAGTIFNDENKSGIKDATEKGIAGIELGLYLIGSSTLVQTVKSDVDGNYLFSKIEPDKTYEIKPISIPSQYEVIKNSNFDQNGKSIQFDLKSQDKKKNINLALFENIPVSDIKVEPKELIQFVGDTGKLKVTITPNNATDKEVTFTSADPSIMTVDKEGNWAAKAIGNTVITVTTKNGKTDFVRVTVKEIPVDGISVEPKVLDQYVGDTGKLKVTITPDNATNKNVTYTVVDPSIMTIDKDGNWEAKAPGSTMIIVTTSNGKLATVQVTVREKEVLPESITVEPKVLDQFVGDTGKLKVTFQPSNTTVKDVTFTSADPSIMTVDKDGNWEAKAPGKTVIIVMTPNGKMSMVNVTVREREIPVDGLTVEPSVLDQYVGDTGSLKVTITPSNATNKNVTFISANPEIMTVDKEGNWVAKAVGKTTITVTASNGKTAIVQVTVREREIPVDGLTVEPSVLDQYVGDTGSLKVTITPSNATNKNVTFISANPEIMTVDKEGNWVAKAVGKTTITVTASNGKTAIVQVTVREREIPVDGLTVEPSVLDQYVGDTGSLKVTITPSNATNKNVTFISANPEIMTVDKEGNWVAKAVGETTITVTASNGKTAIVKVTVRKKQGVGATFYDFPKYLGYFIEKGIGTATNFDDDYNNVEPYPGLGTDYYKVKKVGYVTVKDTGMYTFSIEVDDNGSVYLDDEKIIDRDNIIGGALSNFRHLKAGQTIKITTEHYNKEAPVSYFHLKWQTPSNPYSPKAIPDSEITMD